MDLIEFSGKIGEYKEAINFLKAVDADYFPSLSSRQPLGEYIKPIMQNGVVAYFKDKGKIIAMIGYHYHHPKYGAAYIETISVHKSYRGKKLGKLMIDRCLSDLKSRKIKKVRLRTWSANEASKSLYVKSGFSIYSIVKDDRGPGVDSIYFERDV